MWFPLGMSHCLHDGAVIWSKGRCEAAPNLWTLGLDRFWVMVVDSLRSVFRHARVRSAVPQVHCLGQAGRGQTEHWLQRVPVGQVFEFSGTQVAEG